MTHDPSDDDTQPIAWPTAWRAPGAPLPGMTPPEPGTGPRSAQEPAPGTRARHAPRRRSRGPRSATAGYAGRLRATGGGLVRAPGTLARAVASRWDDIWPPIVGIFLGSLLAAIALVVVFSAWLRWF